MEAFFTDLLIPFLSFFFLSLSLPISGKSDSFRCYTLTSIFPRKHHPKTRYKLLKITENTEINHVQKHKDKKLLFRFVRKIKSAATTFAEEEKYRHNKLAARKYLAKHITRYNGKYARKYVEDKKPFTKAYWGCNAMQFCCIQNPIPPYSAWFLSRKAPRFYFRSSTISFNDKKKRCNILWLFMFYTLCIADV